MGDLSRDSVVNVIHNGIKRDLRVALDNNCLRAAVILTYAGIDAMAFIGLPAKQDDVTRREFVAWAERYVRFSGPEQLSGLELYGARCAMLHNYSLYSSLTRSGKCRTLGYMDRAEPPLRSMPEKHPHLVLVSVPGLAEAFLHGIDRFLVDVFANPESASVAETRFKKLVHQIPA
jgi:hypothetical protein